MAHSDSAQSPPGPDARAVPVGGRPVVGAAFDVLAALPRVSPAGQVAAIARVTGIPRTSVRRLLHQLADAEIIGRSAGGWQLAPRLLQLTYHVDTATHLRALAAPVVHELRAQTGATVSLVVPDGTAFVALDMVPGRFDLPFVARSGFIMPEGSAAVQALTREHALPASGSAEDDQAVVAGTTCYAVAVSLPDGTEAALQVATSPDLPAWELDASVRRASVLIARRAREGRLGFVG